MIISVKHRHVNENWAKEVQKKIIYIKCCQIDTVYRSSAKGLIVRINIACYHEAMIIPFFKLFFGVVQNQMRNNTEYL